MGTGVAGLHPLLTRCLPAAVLERAGVVEHSALVEEPPSRLPAVAWPRTGQSTQRPGAWLRGGNTAADGTCSSTFWSTG